jgi:hypothetical protein
MKEKLTMKRKIKKTRLEHIEVGTPNIWFFLWYKGNLIEIKLNKIIKFNYRITQCQRAKLKKN